MPASPNKLPYELIDMVLSDIAAEYMPKETLKSCALVCKAWHAVAQTYIFRFVTLSSPPALERLAKLISKSPAIGLYIRRIALVQHPWSNKRVLANLYKLPHLSYAALPRVSEIEMSGMKFSNDEVLLAIQHFHTYRSLRSLHLYDCRFPAIDSMYTMLHGFPTIRVFTCHDTFLPIAQDSRPIVIPAELQALPPLEVFKIDAHQSGYHYGQILAPILKLPFRSTISEYGFAPHHLHLGHIKSFLHNVGSEVTSLDLSQIPWYSESSDLVPAVILLPELPNLQKLSLAGGSVTHLPSTCEAIREIDISTSLRRTDRDRLLKAAICRIQAVNLPNLEHLQFTAWSRQLPSLADKLYEDSWILKECAELAEKGIRISTRYTIRLAD